MRSARRIERNQLQPRANQLRGRTRPDPLEGAWEEELVPLLQGAPALTPITLLEHLAAPEACFRLDSAATELAASGAGVEGGAWHGSGSNLPFELRPPRSPSVTSPI